MLEKVLHHIRNWFVCEMHAGKYTIENGSVELPFLMDGQYFRIVGSILNDGVYQYPAVLVDETFSGEIWALAIPQALLDTVTKIEEWETKNGAAARGPFSSESFGGYSYTKGKDNKTGQDVTWQSEFRSDLNFWRKI